MQFMLCGNFLNFDKICQCFFNKNKEKDSSKPNIGQYSLVIDKRLSTYSYALKQEQTRISLVDLKTAYINTPNLNTLLPPIFITKSIKGKLLQDVIHSDVAIFYKNLVLSTFHERDSVKLHVVLNEVHMLIMTYPILDNKKNIIGCSLLETPFLDVELNGDLHSL